MLKGLSRSANSSLPGVTVSAQDLQIADRFAYAPVRGVGRLAAVGRFIRGLKGRLKGCLPGGSGSDFPVQAVGFGGGLDAEDNRQQVAATAECAERFGE